MALVKSTISLPFSKGLDTKTDSKLVQPNGLLTLENSIFQVGGSLSKRFGNELLGKTIINGTTLSNGSALGSLDDELILFANPETYSYTSASDKWVSKGSIQWTKVTNTPVIRNTAEQSQADVCHDVSARS